MCAGSSDKQTEAMHRGATTGSLGDDRGSLLPRQASVRASQGRDVIARQVTQQTTTKAVARESRGIVNKGNAQVIVSQ